MSPATPEPPAQSGDDGPGRTGPGARRDTGGPASRPAALDDASASGDAPAIDSRASWQAAVRWGVDRAIARGARRLVFVDPDFEHWPLDDATLLQALTAWLRLPQRRLVLLARSYDEVPRRFARFTAWRRPFVHAIEAWRLADDTAPELPTLLLDDGTTSLQLIDTQHWRGRVALDGRHATLWHERVDALLQQSEPSFAVNTLGL